jgi:hypothetical protein
VPVFLPEQQRLLYALSILTNARLCQCQETVEYSSRRCDVRDLGKAECSVSVKLLDGGLRLSQIITFS